MENQKTKTTSSIEELRNLAKIQKEGEIEGLLKEIRSANAGLRTVFTQVKEKRQELSRQQEIAEELKQANEKVIDKSKEILGEKAPKSFDTKNRPNNKNQFNKPQNNRFDGKRPSGNRFEGNRPGGNRFDNKKPGTNRFDNKKPGQFNKPGNRPFEKKRFDNDKPATTDAPKTVRNKFANADKPKTKNNYDKKKAGGYNKKQLMRRGITQEREIEERMVARRLKVKKPKQVAPVVKKEITHAVITTDNLTVKILAESIGKPVAEIVKKLFLLGIMATINSSIDYETAELVATELGITLERKVEKTYEEKLEDEVALSLTEDKDKLKDRPPIVTVMGHVDHGKTSLLDAIRSTNVISGEAGGITQHIGAYQVTNKKGKITFIDTPGHAAFTEMRARGAKVTDVAILVVAADDAVMPQTIEAINHIKAADVPMVVAINKIDKPEANVERVKQQLADHNVLAEEWGGDAVMVPVSAHTKEGLDKLLEMILLVAEMGELKANPDRNAIGTIIEAKLDKGKGPVATIIVQNGTLNVGDTVVSGVASGRIRAMMDENGKPVKVAPPSTPVAVLGFDEVPKAGDFVNAVEASMAKQVVEERLSKIKQEKVNSGKAVNLDDLFSKVKEGALKNLNIIVKAGVMGTVEALKQSLSKLVNEEVKVNIVHGGAGAITESDVLLAEASSAIIIGFNVRPDANAKRLAEKAGIDIRFYRVIYEVIDDIKAAMKGMLAPKFEEVVLGHAEVRVLFKVSKIGTIAGCMVQDGRITRNAGIRLLRENVVITETSIDTLRIQKDDVKEAKSGFECGIKLKGFNDLKEGDIIEAFESVQVEV